MADTATVGILKTMLMMDTASYEAGAKKTIAADKAIQESITGLSQEVKKLTPLAERMVKGFGGDKLLYTANSITAAVTKLGGAQKLTEAEQSRVNATLTKAIDKYKALGQEAPKALLDMERATRKVDDSSGKLSVKLVALGAAAGAFAERMGSAAIRALVRFGAEAFEDAGRLVDLSAKTGLTTETLQRMEAVAGQTGSSLDDMTAAAFRLGVRISGGGDSVEAAVTKLRQESGDLRVELGALQRMKPDEMWRVVIEALGQVESATKRNELGVALFGKQFASIAAGVSADYKAIADAAKVSTDAQLQALDAVGDRLDKFSKDLKATYRGALADSLFFVDELKRMGWGDLFRMAVASGGDLPGAVGAISQIGQARAAAAAAAKRATEDAAKATEAAATKEVDYVKALEAARAELGKLDAAERQQLNAAQQLGKSQDELEDMVVKFGVSSEHADAVLKLYNDTMRAGEAASKKLAKSQKDLAKDAAEAAKKIEDSNRVWLDILGGIERSQMQADEDRKKAKEQSDREWLDLQGKMERDAMQREHDAREKQIDAQKKADADYRQYRNEVGEREIEDEERRQQAREQAAEAHRQRIQAIFAPLANITSDLGSLIFGGGDRGAAREDANRAKEHLEMIQRTGKATAEELTRAFQDWRQAEERANEDFGNRFTSLWNTIKRAVTDTLNNILSYFTNQFLGGMLRAISGGKLGQIFGGALGGGGGLGGLLGGAGTSAGAGVLMSAAGGAGAAGAAAGTSVLNSSALVGFTPAGAAAGGGGLGAAMGAFFTNPWTIGIGAAIGVGLLLKKIFGGPSKQELAGRAAREAFTAPLVARLTPKQLQEVREGVGQGHSESWMRQAVAVRDLYMKRGHSAEEGLRAFDLLLKAEKRGADAVNQVANQIRTGATITQPTGSVFSGRGMSQRTSFAMGGFVPPNTVVPAVLHGGQFGEVITPLKQPANTVGGPGVQFNAYVTVKAWDTEDVRRGMPGIIDEIKFEVLHNKRGLVPAISRAQGLL